MSTSLTRKGEVARPIVWRRVGLFAVLGCAALAVAVLRSSGVMVPANDAMLLRSETVSHDDGTTRSTHSTEAAVVAAADGFTIDVTNEYSKNNETSNYKYPFLYGVSTALLVEPHRGSVLTISLPLAGATYAWTFDGASASGSSITVHPDSTGLQTLLVVETGSKGAVTRSQTFTVYVKYVRRELRQLSFEDRVRFLDAAATMWKVNTVEGRLIYGDKYVDINQLAIIHNDLAGNQYCDFIHGGMGYAFGNAHAALNGMLEQSLQAVDSRVSLAFWDYTLDYWENVDRGVDGAYSEESHDLVRIWDSEIFSAAFFGASDNETGVITSGRWAHTTVPMLSEKLFNQSGLTGEWLTTGFATCVGQNDAVCDQPTISKLNMYSQHQGNSFGLLRAPWNMRAENTVVRSNKMCGRSNNNQFPDCTAITDQQDSYTVWSEYIIALMFSPHGTVHVFTGGAFGDCSEVYSETIAAIVQNASIVTNLQMDSSNLQKNLWMSNIKVCPEKSSCVGLAQNDCICTCPDLADLRGENVTDDDVTSSSMWSQLVLTVSMPNKYDDALLALSTEAKIDLLTLVCETDVLTGEMMGSNSPLDITFFATHAEVERMLQRQMLSGNITDMTWPNKTMACPGERAAYKQVWFNYKLDTPLETTNLTNVQWRDILNPANPEYATHIPYVYENFEWEHCRNYQVGVESNAATWDSSLMNADDWLWLKDKEVTVKATAIAQQGTLTYANTNRPGIKFK